jgi:hypothetical protein
MNAKTLSSLTTPAGTSGLAVEPWAAGEIYAVAANWSQASAPVYCYGQTGWHLDRAGRQVADFGHIARAALVDAIVDAIAVSEGIPSDEVGADEVDRIVSDAVDITDGADDAE